ncbi:hypothetical protein K9M16_05005 [Candidatus Babeliales bacterium]|nr:hypothetical protein [Candidatus Babeliales bacterium]MCF7910140.1 hypothetical protein [Candidatus Pacearchaeota archaeon]
MIKKSLGIFIFIILLGVLIVSSGFVSAESEFINNIPVIGDWAKGNLNDGTVNLLVLLLLVVLIYSIFGYVNFPENSGIQFLIAIILGFLSTYALSAAEVSTFLLSYSALSTAIILFFPILIIGFFSYVAVMKDNFFAVFSQKILWLIYSLYLLLSSGLTLLLKNASILGLETGKWGGFFAFFDFNIKTAGNYSSTILVIQFIVAIAVFWIFVLRNKTILNWIAGEKKDWDLSKMQERLERAGALEKARADATKS